jgi:BlaI family transcriptional regulator, penicillinase repressor
MSKKLIKPTEGELEILQVLWAKGPSSVRDVHEVLSAQRETGYTTTLKLLQIMLDKGLVKRNAESRTHIYEAGVREEDVQNQLLSRFLDSAFRGSASQLILQALGNHKASQKELEQIKALIEKIEKNQKP